MTTYVFSRTQPPESGPCCRCQPFNNRFQERNAYKMTPTPPLDAYSMLPCIIRGVGGARSRRKTAGKKELAFGCWLLLGACALGAHLRSRASITESSMHHFATSNKLLLLCSFVVD
jgi:hypothetical protein